MAHRRGGEAVWARGRGPSTALARPQWLRSQRGWARPPSGSGARPPTVRRHGHAWRLGHGPPWALAPALGSGAKALAARVGAAPPGGEQAGPPAARTSRRPRRAAPARRAGSRPSPAGALARRLTTSSGGAGAARRPTASARYARACGLLRRRGRGTATDGLGTLRAAPAPAVPRGAAAMAPTPMAQARARLPSHGSLSGPPRRGLCTVARARPERRAQTRRVRPWIQPGTSTARGPLCGFAAVRPCQPQRGQDPRLLPVFRRGGTREHAAGAVRRCDAPCEVACRPKVHSWYACPT